MSERLENLCEWKITIFPKGLNRIKINLNSALMKMDFKEDKREKIWRDGRYPNVFTVETSEHREKTYCVLAINLNSREILTKAPIISIIDHSLRRYGRYIISSQFSWGPHYDRKEQY